jgi:hypothetical protein
VTLCGRQECIAPIVQRWLIPSTAADRDGLATQQRHAGRLRRPASHGPVNKRSNGHGSLIKPDVRCSLQPAACNSSPAGQHRSKRGSRRTLRVYSFSGEVWRSPTSSNLYLSGFLETQPLHTLLHGLTGANRKGHDCIVLGDFNTRVGTSDADVVAHLEAAVLCHHTYSMTRNTAYTYMAASRFSDVTLTRMILISRPPGTSCMASTVCNVFY